MSQTTALISKYRWKLASAGVGVAGFLLIFMLLIPQTTSLIDDTGDWVQARQTLQMSDIRLTEGKLAAEAKRGLRTQLAMLAVSATDSASSSILSTFQTNAQRSGLVLNRIEPHLPDTIDAVEATLFDLEFTGGFHQVGRFLVDIENGPIPIRIRKLELVSSTASSSTLNVQARIEAYQFLPPSHPN